MLDPFVRASRRVAYNHSASILAEVRSSVSGACREILKWQRHSALVDTMGRMSINQAPRVDVNHSSAAASVTGHSLVDQNKMSLEEDFLNYSFENYLPGAEVTFQGLILSRIGGGALTTPHGFSPRSEKGWLSLDRGKKDGSILEQMLATSIETEPAEISYHADGEFGASRNIYGPLSTKNSLVRTELR
jgi:hypothetical protein